MTQEAHCLTPTYDILGLSYALLTLVGNPFERGAFERVPPLRRAWYKHNKGVSHQCQKCVRETRHPFHMFTAFIARKLAEAQMKASLESHRKLPRRGFLVQCFGTTRGKDVMGRFQHVYSLCFCEVLVSSLVSFVILP